MIESPRTPGALTTSPRTNRTLSEPVGTTPPEDSLLLSMIPLQVTRGAAVPAVPAHPQPAPAPGDRPIRALPADDDLDEADDELEDEEEDDDDEDEDDEDEDEFDDEDEDDDEEDEDELDDEEEDE